MSRSITHKALLVTVAGGLFLAQHDAWAHPRGDAKVHCVSCRARAKSSCQPRLNKVSRPRNVSIHSFVVQRAAVPRGDPWFIRGDGFGRNTKLHVQVNDKLEAIDLPGSREAHAALRRALPKIWQQTSSIRDPKQRVGKIRTLVRRVLSRQWQAAVGKAEVFSDAPDKARFVTDKSYSLPEGTEFTHHDGPTQTWTSELVPTQLQIHLPYRITAKDAARRATGGRKVATVRGNVEGRLEAWTSGGQVTTHSSMTEPHFSPVIQTNNIFASLPDQDGNVTVILPKAISYSANVAAKNTVTGQTVFFQVGKVKTRPTGKPASGDKPSRVRSGGDRFVIRAAPGERIELSAAYPAARNDHGPTARPTRTVAFFEVPRAGDSRPAIVKRRRNGRRTVYHRVRAQPDQLRVDQSKLYLSTAMNCRTLCNKVVRKEARLAGLEDAISRGATIEVTNMRMRAERHAGHTVTFNTAQVSSTKLGGHSADFNLAVPGNSGDRLLVTISYPDNRGSQSISTEIPFGGKASFKDGALSYFPVAEN